MRRTRVFALSALAVLGIIGAGLTGTAGDAAATSRVVVTDGAAIRVWVDDTRDVYTHFDDVAVTLRAQRDCYATVFIVDTDGYVHVVRPLTPWEPVWLIGGRTYRYNGYELGLSRLAGRGIVHVFAVSSPHPFDFSAYGETIFAGRFGFRIYGDPFIACREITLSILPAGCGPDLVSVGFARFYVREWTRYPGYLCRGHDGLHVRVGRYCSACAGVYDAYRLHVADPYVVIHPRATFQKRPSHYAEVKRSTVRHKTERREAIAAWSHPQGRRAKSIDRSPQSRVVSRKPSGGARVISRSGASARTTGKAVERSAPGLRSKTMVSNPRRSSSSSKRTKERGRKSR